MHAPTEEAHRTAGTPSRSATTLMLAMQADRRADATRRNCHTTLHIALDDAVVNGLNSL